MNRLLSIFVLWLCQLALFAQAGAVDSIPGPDLGTYELTLKSSPQGVAGFNYSNKSRILAGSRIWVYADVKENFVLDYWLMNNEQVPDQGYGIELTMPENDVTLTAVCHYDPMSPGNPQAVGDRYWVTLESQPKGAGSFNWAEKTKCEEGKVFTVIAYNRYGFEFKGWKNSEEQWISFDQSYKFTMPSQAITLTAVYEYNPQNPGNPRKNYFDEETGEVIIDDFNPGDLWSAFYEVTQGSYEGVTSITVAGQMKDWDWYIANDCRSCTTLDISRTNATFVPSWQFDGNSTLETIMLPASLEMIDWCAFENCTALSTIGCHAVVPPVVDPTAFDGVNPDMVTVYVPAKSVSLYQAADVWKNFTILPFQEEVKSLTVGLPEEVAPLYKDMYIELLNLKNGQRMRYVITDRVVYTFYNLLQNTSYNVYLKNAQDFVLGEIDNVEIVDKDKSVTFENLLVPRKVRAKVLTLEGADVTEKTTVIWSSDKGVFLTRGTELANQLRGTMVKVSVQLSQELAMKYLLVPDSLYEVRDAADNVVNITLEDIPQLTIGGLVRNVKTEQPLAGATISVSQMLNGLYSQAFTTKTNEQGQWSQKVFAAPTEVTASKTNFVSQSLAMPTPLMEVPTFNLKDINGTMIFLNVTYTDVDGNTKNSYDDMSNVTFAVYNEATGEQYTEMNLQFPQIVLMDSHAQGTKLRVVATSKNEKFMPVEVVGTVGANDRVDVTIAIKQLGGIKATYIRTDNPTIVGILYDSNGRLVKKYDYSEKALTISELKDGNYTLVTMAGSQFFNSIYTIGQFTESGLRQGVDYMKNNVAVKSGKMTNIANQIIPYLDETKLYYTSDNTSFSVNKNQITAGQYLTVSAHLDFKSKYVSGISDVKLIVGLPEQSSFVDNSVMYGNSTIGYTYADHVVTIPLDSYDERIRFCFIPLAGGDYSAAAAVQFTFDGRTITQPIGNAGFTVKNLSLTVPAVVASTKVPVSGTAMSKATVKVYADDVLLGQTVALANGSWATTIELDNPESPSVHNVYAVVTTQQGAEMISETQQVKYDEDAIQVEGVTMYYTNPEENWWQGKNYELLFNFLTPSVVPLRYTYYIYNRSFTFSIRFNNNNASIITKVILEVKTGDGVWNPLETVYNANKGCWIAYGEFGNMYDGIVPVNVRVRYWIGGYEYLVVYPGPNCDVPIDPSGYVYEAVSTNRVQGVTATIYYKETVEDQYGDLHENIVLWNAEEYAQENPLFTDENGMYRWDVPQGLWQVKFEKEGYQTVYSEWLPVPPPQLDVNIAITQLMQPQVLKASASKDGVEIEFDKFMDIETLNTDNIEVTCNGEKVEGEIVLVNEETVSEDSEQTYASKVRFALLDDKELLPTDEVTISVKSLVKSYAGVTMQDNFSQDFEVVKKVRSISTSDNEVNVAFGGQRTLKVAALPADASRSKKLTVKSLSAAIAKTTVNEVTLDENGEAEIVITGEMPGQTVLTFKVDGVDDVEGRLTVNVKDEARLITVAPKASRVSGTEVYRGTQISLSSETENAVIYYTLDGSEPTEKSIKYDDEAPITIANDITIKAIAKGHDLLDSEVKTFTYTLKRTSVGYQMPEGWTWISHNLEEPVAANTFKENAERIMSQTQELINDPVAGLVGNLTELLPTEAYKVKVSAQTTNCLQGYEFNATTSTVPVEIGWNWIGYPVNQIMTIAEVFEFFGATEGDYVVGQDGFAEYTDGEWRGTLEGMKPGQGYLYKSSVKGELLFNTTIVSVAASRVGKFDYLMNSPWAPAKYAYPDVMPLTAQLYAGDVKVNADEYVVGAFAGTECRGVGIWKDDRLLMSIYGQPGDEITFVAIQTATGNCYDLTEQMGFQADNIGTWNMPSTLTIGGQVTGIEKMYDKLTVTPAVARDYIIVSAGGHEISNLTLTNMSGKNVLSLSNLGKSATVTTGQLPAGVYIATVQANGKSYYKKILKVNK